MTSPQWNQTVLPTNLSCDEDYLPFIDHQLRALLYARFLELVDSEKRDTLSIQERIHILMNKVTLDWLSPKHSEILLPWVRHLLHENPFGYERSTVLWILSRIAYTSPFFEDHLLITFTSEAEIDVHAYPHCDRYACSVMHHLVSRREAEGPESQLDRFTFGEAFNRALMLGQRELISPPAHTEVIAYTLHAPNPDPVQLKSVYRRTLALGYNWCTRRFGKFMSYLSEEGQEVYCFSFESVARERAYLDEMPTLREALERTLDDDERAQCQARADELAPRVPRLVISIRGGQVDEISGRGIGQRIDVDARRHALRALEHLPDNGGALIQEIEREHRRFCGLFDQLESSGELPLEVIQQIYADPHHSPLTPESIQALQITRAASGQLGADLNRLQDLEGEVPYLYWTEENQLEVERVIADAPPISRLDVYRVSLTALTLGVFGRVEIKQSHQLVSISLSAADELWINRCAQLTELEVKQSTRAVIKNLPLLTRLQLKAKDQVTLSACPELHQFRVRARTFIASRLFALSHDDQGKLIGVTAQNLVLNHCPQLRRLSGVGLGNITLTDLFNLVELQFARIKKLRIRRCPGLVTARLSNFKSLEIIDSPSERGSLYAEKGRRVTLERSTIATREFNQVAEVSEV